MAPATSGVALSPPAAPTNDDDILALIFSAAPGRGVGLAAAAGAAAVVAAGAVALPRLFPHPGPARLAAVLPLLVVLSALPLTPPPSVVLRGTVAFMCWLAAMKLIAWGCGRGALALPHLTDAQRALLLLLPITPLHQPHQQQPTTAATAKAPPPATAWRTAALAALNAAALATFIVVLRADASSPSPMPPILRHAMYAAVVYLAVSLVLDSFAPLALASAFGGGSASSSGPALAPSMRAPWGARSLGSFWSYHYNTAVSDALRHCAYAPVAQGSLFKRGGGGGSTGGGGGHSDNKDGKHHPHHRHRHHVSQARRATGLTVVFLVSGLAHEIIAGPGGFMCGAAKEQRRLLAARRGGGAAAGPAPSNDGAGLMMLFFLAQVPALLLEQRAHEWARDRRRRRRQEKEQRHGEANGGHANGDGDGAVAVTAAAGGGGGRGGWASAASSLASHAIRAALTLLALLIMTDAGFFPAMEACAVDRAGIDEVGAAVDRVVVAVAAAARGAGWWGRP